MAASNPAGLNRVTRRDFWGLMTQGAEALPACCSSAGTRSPARESHSPRQHPGRRPLATPAPAPEAPESPRTDFLPSTDFCSDALPPLCPGRRGQGRWPEPRQGDTRRERGATQAAGGLPRGRGAGPARTRGGEPGARAAGGAEAGGSTLPGGERVRFWPSEFTACR